MQSHEVQRCSVSKIQLHGCLCTCVCMSVLELCACARVCVSGCVGVGVGARVCVCACVCVCVCAMYVCFRVLMMGLQVYQCIILAELMM